MSAAASTPAPGPVGVTAPAGFRAAGVACGIKSAGRDLALVVNDGPEFAAAGVFTRNRVQAAPVRWSRQVLTGGVVRAVVLNSGGANACTGPAGLQDTQDTAAHTAAAFGIDVGQVAVCSTGLIGERLPMDRLRAGVDAAAAALARDATDHPDGGGMAAAEAIMTTDTRPKSVQLDHPAGFTVGGMAKGAGMLAPALATMLAVITTDAVADPATLDAALRQAVRVSFDRLDSDGCMSTNDMVLLLASGASGHTPDPATLTEVVTAACTDLARQLLADAEGHTKQVAIRVTGAASETRGRVGRAVARQLPGQDRPVRWRTNWGRIWRGQRHHRDDRPDAVDVAVNGVWVCRAGTAAADRSWWVGPRRGRHRDRPAHRGGGSHRVDQRPVHATSRELGVFDDRHTAPPYPGPGGRPGQGRHPGGGAAVAGGVPRQHPGGQVRRPRHDRPGAAPVVRHRPGVPPVRRDPAGGGARRRPPDQPHAGTAGGAQRVQGGPAGHQPGSHGRGTDGAGGAGRPGTGHPDQHPRPFAVGLSGRTPACYAVRRTATVDGEPVDLGQVGDVAKVNTSAITDLIDAGRIPVVSTVAPDADGVPHNLNADTAAAALAAALGARKLVVLTDVPGLYADWPATDRVISRLTVDELELLPTWPAGWCRWRPACGRSGRVRPHVIDGRVARSLLLLHLGDSVSWWCPQAPDRRSRGGRRAAERTAPRRWWCAARAVEGRHRPATWTWSGSRSTRSTTPPGGGGRSAADRHHRHVFNLFASKPPVARRSCCSPSPTGGRCSSATPVPGPTNRVKLSRRPHPRGGRRRQLPGAPWGRVPVSRPKRIVPPPAGRVTHVPYGDVAALAAAVTDAPRW